MKEETLLTTPQVAVRLGVTVRRVLALIEAGRLPSQQYGRDHLVKESDLRLVEDRKPGRPPTKAATGANKRATGLVRAPNGISTGGRGKKKGGKR
jgi:excisionase family DNA binding protein